MMRWFFLTMRIWAGWNFRKGPACAFDPSAGKFGLAHTRRLCFPISFTVLACGPFSPISSV
jgi:hypothetical protein